LVHFLVEAAAASLHRVGLTFSFSSCSMRCIHPRRHRQGTPTRRQVCVPGERRCARSGLVFKILLLGAALAQALSRSKRSLVPSSEFSVDAPVISLGATLEASSANSLFSSRQDRRQKRKPLLGFHFTKSHQAIKSTGYKGPRGKPTPQATSMCVVSAASRPIDLCFELPPISPSSCPPTLLTFRHLRLSCPCVDSVGDLHLPGQGPNRASRAFWCQVTHAVATRAIIEHPRCVHSSLVLEIAPAGPLVGEVGPFTRRCARDLTAEVPVPAVGGVARRAPTPLPGSPRTSQSPASPRGTSQSSASPRGRRRRQTSPRSCPFTWRFSGLSSLYLHSCPWSYCRGRRSPTSPSPARSPQRPALFSMNALIWHFPRFGGGPAHPAFSAFTAKQHQLPRSKRSCRKTRALDKSSRQRRGQPARIVDQTPLDEESTINPNNRVVSSAGFSVTYVLCCHRDESNRHAFRTG
jgi:hypothetical protein